MSIEWQAVQGLPSRNYTCGYCGSSLASEKGYWGKGSSNGVGELAYIYICHKCKKPTFFDAQDFQTPGVIFGNDVNDINDDTVKLLYEESRRCTNNNAFTAAVLCCRKLLMHIAVSKGANPGLKFIEYVEYFANEGYIPSDAKDWVDFIRTKGNEANHEIVIMKEEDAKDLISFCEMLLTLIYEFPAHIKRKKSN